MTMSKQRRKKAPKDVLTTPVVLDGRAIPAWGMVLTKDLLSEEVRGLSAVSLRLWLCLIAVAGGNYNGWNCSVKHLVTMVGSSDRQVYRAMSELEKSGLLLRHRTGRTTRYELVSPGQLARVGKSVEDVPKKHAKPDTDDSCEDPKTTDEQDTSELTDRDDPKLTRKTGEQAENEATNREVSDLQKDPTDSSHREPPFPPKGGKGTSDMTGSSKKDATRTRERLSVATGKRTRGIPALKTMASGQLLKRWIDGRMEGLTPATFEAERDLVAYHVETNTDAIVSVLVEGLGVRRRRAIALLDEAKRSALAYIADLQPDPYDAQLEIRELKDRIDKAGLQDQASQCETEADVSALLHALIMNECGY